MVDAAGTKGGRDVTTFQVTGRYVIGADGTVAPPHAVRETGPVDVPKPRLLDRVRAALRTRHYSRRTEEAYVAWIRRYILFHGKRHPAEMGASEVTRFLSALAVEGRVADVVRAKRP